MFQLMSGQASQSPSKSDRLKPSAHAPGKVWNDTVENKTVENNNSGKQQQWKTATVENNNSGKQQQWKTTTVYSVKQQQQEKISNWCVTLKQNPSKHPVSQSYHTTNYHWRRQCCRSPYSLSCMKPGPPNISQQIRRWKHPNRPVEKCRGRRCCCCPDILHTQIVQPPSHSPWWSPGKKHGLDNCGISILSGWDVRWINIVRWIFHHSGRFANRRSMDLTHWIAKWTLDAPLLGFEQSTMFRRRGNGRFGWRCNFETWTLCNYDRAWSYQKRQWVKIRPQRTWRWGENSSIWFGGGLFGFLKSEWSPIVVFPEFWKWGGRGTIGTVQAPSLLWSPNSSGRWGMWKRRFLSHIHRLGP